MNHRLTSAAPHSGLAHAVACSAPETQPGPTSPSFVHKGSARPFLFGMLCCLAGCSAETPTLTPEPSLQPSTCSAVPLVPSGPDLDGDGFSLENGDCTDANGAIYPGAPDSPLDGLDSDCGGLDGPQPSVNLPGSHFANLEAALNAMPDDARAILWVGPGTCFESELSPHGKRFQLRSTHGAAQTFLDAQARGPIFSLTEQEGPATVIDGFTLEHGSGGIDPSSEYGVRGGGGMLVVYASPTLRNLRMRNNSVQGGSGGGIYLSHSQSLLEALEFTQNQAAHGGGLYAQNSELTLRELHFSGNSASQEGGGLTVGGGTLEVVNLRLEDNEASGLAGGAWIQGSTLDAVGLEVINNHGGGMQLDSADARIAASSFIDNTGSETSGNGGGLTLVTSALELEDVLFEGNSGVYGAGLYAPSDPFGLSSSLFMTRTTFAGNRAEQDGGGLLLHAGTLEGTELSFVDNQAQLGGGLDLYQSVVNLTDVTVEGNTATLLGGGLYAVGGNYSGDGVHLTRSRFHHNQAAQGGGLATDGLWPLTLQEVQLTENQAAGNGGGALLLGGEAALDTVLVTGNEAGEDGGGLHSTFVDLVLTQASVIANTARQGGGLYLGWKALIRNSIIGWNSVADISLEPEYGYVELDYSVVYSPEGNTDVLDPESETLSRQDPLLIQPPSKSGAAADLHLRPASWAKDAGDPAHCTALDRSGCDADGSIAELGAYGGPNADTSYYTDSDQDGLYDGWELTQAGTLTALSGSSDADNDGVTDLEELNLGTNPLQAEGSRGLRAGLRAGATRSGGG